MRAIQLAEYARVGAVVILAVLVSGCGDDGGVEPEPEAPRIIVVRPDGSGDYATIQAAIAAAADRDTIELAAGTFRGSGNRDVDFLGKAVTVRAQVGSRSAVVIDCEQSGRGFKFHMQEDSGSVLQGVTITGGSATSGGAVLITDVSSPRILDCVFENNTGHEAGGGIHIHDQSSPVIENSVFSENSTSASGGGVYLSESSPAFLGCTFWSNSAASGGAPAIYNSSVALDRCTISGNDPDGIVCGNSSPVLSSTIIAFSRTGEGISCAEGCNVTLTCCDVFGNAGGDSSACILTQIGVDGIIVEDPLFCDPERPELPLQASSPCASGPCGLMGACDIACDGPPPPREIGSLRH